MEKIEQIDKKKNKIEELLKTAGSLRATSPIAAEVLEKEVARLGKEIQQGLIDMENARLRKIYCEKVTEVLNAEVDKAKSLLGALSADMETWWKREDISLADKLLMRTMLSDPTWLQKWEGFLKKENYASVPIVIVPGEAKYRKGFNIVISSNYEAPEGIFMVNVEGEWDDRDVAKSLEIEGLGESVIIFNIGTEAKKIDSLLMTNQVDMVVINNSRASYDDSEIGYIEKFVQKHGVKKPFLIAPMKTIPDFYEDKWFEGYSYLFKKSGV